MPFIAKLKQTGKRVDINDYENPKMELRQGDIVCRFEDCGAKLFIKDGLTTRAHFAHKPRAPCKTRYGSHPESAAHLAGKSRIADYLSQKLKADGFVSVVVELEAAVPEAGQNGRIADVMVTYPMGHREAHEYQLASITPQELEERTSDYGDQGIVAFWWIGVGSAADNNANRNWLRRHGGEVPILHMHQTRMGKDIDEIYVDEEDEDYDETEEE